MKSFTSLFVVAGLSLASLTTQAHEVWIEDLPTGQLAVRFAEYGEVYETSPGHLDDLSLPESWKVEAAGVADVKVQKAADHFALLETDAKMSIQAETFFKVIGGKPGGNGDDAGPSRRPFFYARWHVFGAEAARPTLNLDLVPTGKPGELCLYFRGKPLPETEVTAHLPDGREQSLKTDANGLVQVSTDQKGLCMVNVKRYREKIDGFSGGKAYNAVSHNCSVAWRQP